MLAMLANSSSFNRGSAKASIRNVDGGHVTSLMNARASTGGDGSRVISNSIDNLVNFAMNLNRSAPPKQEPQAVLVRRKYQLLIVDDSGLIRKLLCKALRAAGHSCDEAADGLQALNKVNTGLNHSSFGYRDGD